MVASRRPLERSGNGSGASLVPKHQERPAGFEGLPRKPVPVRQQLFTALEQKSGLLRQCALLANKVTALEMALAKANQFANYDELTGLPNRRLLLDRYIQAVAVADRHRQGLALLFFDVNDFKCVNDELGHDVGDKLLQQVARRLSSSIRGSDTACRYGGDEFVTLITEVDHRADVLRALHKIRAEFAPPYLIDRHCIRLTVSAGSAIYPEDAQSFTDLLLLADRSMFSNKPGDRHKPGSATTSKISVDTLTNACTDGTPGVTNRPESESD